MRSTRHRQWTVQRPLPAGQAGRRAGLRLQPDRGPTGLGDHRAGPFGDLSAATPLLISPGGSVRSTTASYRDSRPSARISSAGSCPAVAEWGIGGSQVTIVPRPCRGRTSPSAARTLMPGSPDCGRPRTSGPVPVPAAGSMPSDTGGRGSRSVASPRSHGTPA